MAHTEADTPPEAGDFIRAAIRADLGAGGSCALCGEGVPGVYEFAPGHWGQRRQAGQRSRGIVSAQRLRIGREGPLSRSGRFWIIAEASIMARSGGTIASVPSC